MLTLCLLTFAMARTDHPDVKLITEAGIPHDGPALLDYFRRRVVSASDRDSIEKYIRQLGSPHYSEREKASAELLRIGTPTAALLRQAMNDPDVEIASRARRCVAQIEKVPGTALSAAIARQVAVLKPNGAAAVLLSYLPAAEDEVVADELRETLAAVAVTDDRPDPALIEALGDESPIRRAAAGEALVRANRAELTAEARRLLSDPDAEVRLRLALALVVTARDKSAVPVLIDLLAELPQGSGWRAEAVLVRLAGQTAPEESLGPDETARKRCRDAWAKWWDARGATADLTALADGPRLLGHTLLVLSDPRKLAGPSGSRVVELNAAGDVIWRIENLQNAHDAAVIGRDRVIVAEYTGQKVTERDFAGTIFWSKSVPLPVGIEPLPGGRLLIVCRGRVIELDAERDEVRNFARLENDIVAAKLQPSGEPIVLTSKGVALRLNKDWQVTATISVGKIPFFAGIDLLPNGRFLLTQATGVTEFDMTGQAHWTAETPGPPSSVQRLPNGNTLAAGVQKVIELDRQGEIVWEYQPPEGIRAWRARRR